MKTGYLVFFGLFFAPMIRAIYEQLKKVGRINPKRPNTTEVDVSGGEASDLTLSIISVEC